MTETEIKKQVINYLNKNMNHLNLLCVVKSSEEEILRFNYETILEGEFKMPSLREIEAVVTKKMLMEFNLNDPIDEGLFDFKGITKSEKKRFIKTAQQIFVKFIHAQQKAMILAVIDSLNSRIINLNQDFKEVKSHLLQKKKSILRYRDYIFSLNEMKMPTGLDRSLK